MKIKHIILGLLAFVFCITWVISCYLYVENYHNNIYKKKRVYCYDNFRDSLKVEPAIYIDYLHLESIYLDYYNTLELGIEPYLDFNKVKLQGFSPNHPVYILEYSKDSLLVKVISYNNKEGKFKGKYNEGWAYYKLIHESPPPKLK